jgi:hypothetical protein
MKKISLIITSVIILLGVIVFIGYKTLLNQSQRPKTYKPTNTLPTGNIVGTINNVPIPQGEGIIFVVSGGTITTKNFLSDKSTVSDPINQGLYYLGYHFNQGIPDQTATNTPPYVIEYIKKAQSFNITVLRNPVMQTKMEAERYLVSALGIPEDQICRLKYMVSVPNYVSQFYAGLNLGLSFCDAGLSESRMVDFVNEFQSKGGILGVPVCTQGEASGCVKFGDTNPDVLSAVLEMQDLCKKNSTACQFVLSSGNEPNPQEVALLGSDNHVDGEAVDIRTGEITDIYFKKLFTLTDSQLIVASPKTIYTSLLPSGIRVVAYHPGDKHWHIQVAR